MAAWLLGAALAALALGALWRAWRAARDAEQAHREIVALLGEQAADREIADNLDI